MSELSWPNELRSPCEKNERTLSGYTCARENHSLDHGEFASVWGTSLACLQPKKTTPFTGTKHMCNIDSKKNWFGSTPNPLLEPMFPTQCGTMRMQDLGTQLLSTPSA